jgi:hypothetical protein
MIELVKAERQAAIRRAEAPPGIPR